MTYFSQSKLNTLSRFSWRILMISRSFSVYFSRLRNDFTTQYHFRIYALISRNTSQFRKKHFNRQIALAAKPRIQLGLPSTGGSDCCYAEHVGKTATKLVNPISNMVDLIREIQEGGRREIWQPSPGVNRKHLNN